MTHKLTEEQQRAAHKVIKANQGNCAKRSNYLNCTDCPWFKNKCTGVISNLFPSPEFRVENLRRSQAWLDEHITDAEIMAESPREFCERMVRTQGIGNCKPLVSALTCKNSSCVIHDKEKICGFKSCFDRAKAYLAAHPATPQEPPKRRPTPEEMVIGATVRVRLLDELVKDGELDSDGDILFQKSASFFNKAMRQFCGTTHKVIKGGRYSRLDGCDDWRFIPEMLDYVEPEKAVDPKATEPVNFFDWMGKKVVFKDGRNNGASYTVCEVAQKVEDNYIHTFRLFEIKNFSFSANLFNLCETQDKPETMCKILSTPQGRANWLSRTVKPFESEKAPVIESIIKGKVDNLPSELRFFNFGNSVDGLRIVDLESQVKDLTKKLAASERKCDRLARRLRAKWQAGRDGEMATREEIIDWYHAEKGSACIRESGSTILPKGRTTWIPATRENLKL